MAAIDIDELFDRTLQGDYDDDAPWGAVNALRRIGTRQVFEKAAEWFSVACALGSLPNDALSVATLLTLMEDADEDVRDWATFGLGVLGDEDSAEIRDALYLRLNGSNADVREEALIGLAKRHDTRGLATLLKALEQPTITDRIVEAAYTILGMDTDREDWSRQDYTDTLRERFRV
jgi:HEAT repeat protein